MLKWLLPLVGVALIGWFVVYQRNAVKTSYVNGLPAYNQLPGREYIFERDCYIFNFKSHPASWPLVGTHETVPELPTEVSAKNIGTKLPGIEIIDIAHIGDRFRIVSVRREQSRTETKLSLEVLFMDEERRKYPRLDAYFMLEHRGRSPEDVPVFREDFAVPRVAL